MGDDAVEIGAEPPKFYTPSELAGRWRISTRTLDRWRAHETGPCWLRLKGRVLYGAEDVVAFEKQRLHCAGTAAAPRPGRSRV